MGIQRVKKSQKSISSKYTSSNLKKLSNITKTVQKYKPGKRKK